MRRSSACARAADADRVEVGRLEQDRRRACRDLGVSPPMTPAIATGFVGVGDHEHVRRQLAVDAVERAHALARPAPAHDDAPAAELAVVEGVQRLAHLEHDVVGYVDDVVDRPHARRRAGAPASTPATARP